MRGKSLSLRLIGALLALALLGAACGGGSETGAGGDTGTTGSSGSSEDATGMESTEAVAVDAGAPALAQALTNLLDSHVYLAGIAIVEGVTNGIDSPQFTTAAKELDQNSVALGDAIGSVYGDEARDAFLPLWRKHIGFFVDYTVAKAEGDKQGEKQAKKNLDGYRQDFGELIEGATEGALPADAVAEALKAHVESLFKAIDSVIAGDGKAFDLLREAAAHMPETATALAGGIAQSRPEDFPGAADGPASQVQVTLTHLLDDHVYLAGIAISMGVANGLDSPEFEAAAGALDKNSVQLADTVDSVYPGSKDAFLPLWRKHIGFFVDYTVAKAEGDSQGAKKAVKNLDGYRQDFGELIEGATEGILPADAVAEALVEHVNTLASAVDGVVAGDMKKALDSLEKAAAHNTALGGALAGAIVQQFPDQFGS